MHPCFIDLCARRYPCYIRMRERIERKNVNEFHCCTCLGIKNVTASAFDTITFLQCVTEFGNQPTTEMSLTRVLDTLCACTCLNRRW